MSRSHNKKRNVGIIYEQIVIFICNRLLENKKSEASIATNIIEKHFRKGTQLHKEYKLFKALAETSQISDNLACSIILEAKKACNSMFDSSMLEKEKSELIKDLNYSFGKGRIFEEKVKNYRTFATIQTLLNEWRKKDASFDMTTEYEIKLHNKLTEVVVEQKHNIPNKIDPLVNKIMNNKFEEKYRHSLNESQKDLIKNFVDDKEDKITDYYSLVKKDCLTTLENYISSCQNKILIEKNNIIKENIQNLDEGNLSKENLKKFLIVAKLKEEILGE
jgi:hypothetical protein